MSAEIYTFPTTEAQRQNRDTLTSERLSRATSIEHEMKNVARLSPEDRSRFALNLGRMYQDASAKCGRNRMDLVKSAVGTMHKPDSAESLWKKRKRFVRFPDEETGADPSAPGEYGADPFTFLELAKLCATFVDDGTPIPQRQQRAILNLVEGTARFDNIQAARERLKLDGLSEYASCLDQLLGNVQRILGDKLNQYFELVNTAPIALTTTKDGYNALPIADDSHWYSSATPTDAQAEDGEYRSGESRSTAPQIFLGTLYAPRTLHSVIPILIDLPDDDDEPEIATADVERILVETYGPQIQADATSVQPLDEFINKYSALGRETMTEITELNPHWDEVFSWDRIDVVLSVEVERSSGQPKLFLGTHALTEDGSPGWVPWLGMDLQEEEDYQTDFWDRHRVWNRFSWSRVENSNAIIVYDDYWSTAHVPDERELFQRVWRATGESGLRLAFTTVLPAVRGRLYDKADAITLNNWFFRPAFKDEPGHYVPVNNDTLAAAMLRNLAWAEVDERLDNRMINDFILKFEAVKQSIKDQRQKYDTAISRFFNQQNDDGV